MYRYLVSNLVSSYTTTCSKTRTYNIDSYMSYLGLYVSKPNFCHRYLHYLFKLLIVKCRLYNYTTLTKLCPRSFLMLEFIVPPLKQ